MILLDTNVLSELMRPQPEPKVMDWFAAHGGMDLFVSAVTEAEIFLGLTLLPEGKRRLSLLRSAELMFSEDFSGRCLSFDASAARRYATLVAHRFQIGRPITTEDGQIAAIALVSDLTLATRNVKDFQEIEGLAVSNPWE